MQEEEEERGGGGRVGEGREERGGMWGKPAEYKWVQYNRNQKMRMFSKK